ncbi:Chaperone protein dnaJ [Mycoemilia scoparia]|uniref:Chaperone protein dnaJ n=1 Tax=Mycoemilia scoparia TaxID=417184 RepID=A0A9W8DUQ8_9FUNG|nr:Chaperone protein dnaJ [Mycoemilia scoparia]
MAMEVNRDEALRCLQIARKKQTEGNHAAALKFTRKSISMYPTEEAKSYLSKLESGDDNSSSTTSSSAKENGKPSAATGGAAQTSSTPGDQGNSGGLRNRFKGTSAESESPGPSKPYTKEQVEAVKRIKASKGDYYKLMGIEKTASDNEIRKAYRKLALQFHPDKNSAPGADEAFKLVSHAFNILSDPNKRSHYDRFGDQTQTASAGPQFRHANGFAGRGQAATMFEDEISPEDLFNMFFGGNMGGVNFGPQVRVRQYGSGGGNSFFGFQTNGRNAATAAARNRNGEANSGTLAACIQFLPLILLFTMFLISNFFSAFTNVEENPGYSFNRQGLYNSERATGRFRVPYWVNNVEFSRSYIARHPSRIREFEYEIEQHHISNLQRECQKELKRKRAMKHAATGWFGLVKDPKKLKEAEQMKLPSCSELTRFK